MASETTCRVVEALDTLYASTDNKLKRDADRWLGTFQKTPEAWTVADYLLKQKDALLETRLFAAQTFKQKITYDLSDLDANARVQLRDSLVELLWQSAKGPKAIIVQLCLAIADLAIQLLDWKTVIPDLVEKFKDTPVCLLELLSVLPEEMNNNTKLPLTDVEYKMRGAELIDSNAERVLQLLTMYMQSSGNDIGLQERIFTCFSSWIRSGELDIQMLSQSPLLEFAFKGLESVELFDVAVDVVCEIIYETRDVNECQSIIQQIYPCFTPMVEKLMQAIEEDDDDTVRGYCRIFVSAGEAYINLIGSHPEAFTTLIDGILKCTAYKELEIVPLTFKFWFELSNLLQTETYAFAVPQFLPYYDALVDIMIVHLHYPEDLDSMTAEDRDDFRDFRHQMGDTLKDCCRILTPQRCLLKPMNLLTVLLNTPDATWQQIEAPIFSLRVMGSEVPAEEDQVMPHIMEFLSKLPDHPKIRYAATLVISRYSFWTKLHPQYVTYQLNFISSGFQNSEVAAASALALKNLCKDCSELLVDYISQLHLFYLNVVKTLPFRDVLEVTQAVSYVMTVIPVTEIEKALQLFCLPIAQDLHSIVSKGKDGVSKEECVKIGDILEQISVFFDVIQLKIELGQAHPCVTFIGELWPVLDITLTNFGDLSTVTEPLCKCFNSFIRSYGPHFIPLLPQLMERLVNAFEATGQSCYLWVSFKLVREYALDKGDSAAPCFQLVQRLSQSMFRKLQKVDDIPDVIEEYFRMMTAYLDKAPLLLVQDELLQTVFQAGIVSLSIHEPHALSAVLIFFTRLLDHTEVLTLYTEYGNQLTAVLFNGLVDYYHQDSIPDVAALLKSLAEHLPNESTQWMINVVNNVPQEYMSIQFKNDFIANWTGAISGSQWAKVRRVLSDFVTAYRRRNTNKDRR